MKYQSWAGVSSNRNWKPAEVMQGGSPGSALGAGEGWERRAEKGPHPHGSSHVFWFISGRTPLSSPFSVKPLHS